MLRLLIDVSYAEPQDLRLPQRHRSLSQSCPPSDSSSLASPSESDDNSKELSHSSRPRSRSHIPRPRNAFMIFRSEFCAGEKISRSVERDHRHISRIIGYYWNKLPESEKDVWRRKAEQEKSEHLRKYPGYRFTPTVRAKRPVKRNVKRNGADDLLRCQILADFLMLGKEGKDLEDAAKTLEADTQPPATRVDGSIYDSFPENDRMPSFHRSSYAEMPGNLVVGFPVQSYCYPSTAERVSLLSGISSGSLKQAICRVSVSRQHQRIQVGNWAGQIYIFAMVNLQEFSISFGRSPLTFPLIIIQPGNSLPCLAGNNTMIHHLSTHLLFSFPVINHVIQSCINGRYLHIYHSVIIPLLFTHCCTHRLNI